MIDKENQVMSTGRKIVSLILIGILVGSMATGCSNKDTSSWLYSCDPDNMIGLRGYYYEDGNMYMVFDTKEIRKHDNLGSGLPYAVENKELRGNRPLYIFLEDDDSATIDPEDIDLNITGKEMIISFPMDAEDVDEIIGFDITSGGYVHFDREAESITTTLYGGEVNDNFIQTYDSEHGRWSEIEHEQIFFPMTVEEG